MLAGLARDDRRIESRHLGGGRRAHGVLEPAAIRRRLALHRLDDDGCAGAAAAAAEGAVRADRPRRSLAARPGRLLERALVVALAAGEGGTLARVFAEERAHVLHALAAAGARAALVARGSGLALPYARFGKAGVVPAALGVLLAPHRCDLRRRLRLRSDGRRNVGLGVGHDGPRIGPRTGEDAECGRDHRASHGANVPRHTAAPRI